MASLEHLERLNRSTQGALAATSKLEKHAKDVRNNTVNWKSYFQGQMISQEVYDFISTFDKTNKETREKIISQSPQQFVTVFRTLIEKIAKDQTLQYILTMLDDALEEERTRVELFKEYAKKRKESVWQPFFHLLDRDDKFIVYQAARIISKIACYSCELMDKKNLQSYLVWLRDQLKAPNNEYLQTAVRCLQSMLTLPQYRQPFCDVDGVAVVITVLLGSPGFQIHYQLIYCLWCLTFDPDIATAINKHGVIPTLADILSETHKEKVARIILATFKNLLLHVGDDKIRHELALAMVQCKVLKQIELLEARKYEDEDITEDLKYLNEQLHESVRHLSCHCSSLDEYITEIKSGRLEWSPVHKSDRFWHENAAHLNDNNYELLKILVRLLETSKDPLILSVAAHDIGEYVRYYPRGKNVIEQLGAKQLVMQYLLHEDPNVKYEALIAVQKMMVHNWRFIFVLLQGIHRESCRRETAGICFEFHKKIMRQIERDMLRDNKNFMKQQWKDYNSKLKEVYSTFAVIIL